MRKIIADSKSGHSKEYDSTLNIFHWRGSLTVIILKERTTMVAISLQIRNEYSINLQELSFCLIIAGFLSGPYTFAMSKKLKEK